MRHEPPLDRRICPSPQPSAVLHVEGTDNLDGSTRSYPLWSIENDRSCFLVYVPVRFTQSPSSIMDCRKSSHVGGRLLNQVAEGGRVTLLTRTE